MKFFHLDPVQGLLNQNALAYENKKHIDAYPGVQAFSHPSQSKTVLKLTDFRQRSIAEWHD